jgi:hypothetical protein
MLSKKIILTYMSSQHIHAKVCADITFSTIIHARAGTVFMQIPSCKLLGSEVKKVKKFETFSFFHKHHGSILSCSSVNVGR